MKKKAAVVIGVDKTGNLTKLKSAAAGADAVADWLRGEDYDVECLTDRSGQVRARDVEDAIAKLVTLPPRYSLLVVYFSGHGYWHARTDRWLLSAAPTRTSEAINLDGAMDLARYSGIPNVVFISDACRSIPDSRTGAHVTGIDAFPNYAEISNASKVDVFRATSEARSAYEGDIEGRAHSILTYALMSAYREPTLDMIREVIDGSTRLNVVPNRELEDYLQNKVNKILADIDINLTQDIEVDVPSSDDVYISRVQGPVQSTAAGTRSGGGPRDTLVPITMTTGRDAEITIVRTLSSRSSGNRGGDADRLLAVSEPATEARLEARLPDGMVDHIESGIGFTVHGAKIVKAATTKGKEKANVELLETGDGGNTAAIIRLWNAHPAVSVAIQLEDGRCAVLAGLDGYIGHATFDESGLSNVSYVPSANHTRWPMYENRKVRIDRLRALVALAVEDNRFRVRSDAEAETLGNKIRMEKAIDPTLGLYAAHAFSQASKNDRLLDVMHYMRDDLASDLFDVRVLASRHVGERWGNYRFTPFCPMLTETWNLLRPRGISLPLVLQEASPYLCNSLWTTFQTEITNRIMQAVETGELE
ncbi:MAG: caspase family protein [Candidatus Thiodiazotropha sp. (ex. Lucinoma kazani)]